MDGMGNIAAASAAARTGGTLSPDDKARLAKAVKDFESIFLGMMMKSMRTSIPKDEASSESFGGEVMGSLFDQEVARKLSSRSNLGIAEMLYRSITKEPLPGVGTGPPRQGAVHPPTVQAAGNAAAAVRSQAKGDAPGGAAAAQAPPHEAAPQGDHTAAKPRGNVPARQDSTAPTLAPPASVRERIAAYDSLIQAAAGEHGVDSTMLKAVIAAESAGKSRAVSPKNAKGLMQLTDSTAAEMGVRNIWDPEENIQGGAKYLETLMARFPGDTTSVIASYNAGPARVEQHGGVPPIAETRAYVRRVLNYINFFQQEEASHEGR